MTRGWKTLSVAMLVLAGQAVSAQEAKKPPPPGASPPAMAMPKPDAALDAYKDMVGSWKCEGKMNMGGQEIPMKSTAKFSWDVDNFWLVGKFDSAKTKGMPQYKGVAYYGYDAGKKVYVNMGFDNMGGFSNQTSKGREGDTQVWAGKTNMMGKESDSSMTITYKGKNEVHLAEKMGTGPDAVTSDTTCKK